MDEKDFLNQIIKIKDVALATIAIDGKPSNRIIDMMYLEDNCLFFLTARGKQLYKELELNPYVSITICQDKKAYSLSGLVMKVDQSYLPLLFENNKFMYDIYPGETSKVLEIFKIYSWEGEYFDLTARPIFRKTFTNNYKENDLKKYIVNKDKCTSCGNCLKVCPQKCIDIQNKLIIENNCLKCGACLEICNKEAINII